MAQTLQVTVLQPVAKVALHNECGLSMCATTGLEPQSVASAYRKEQSVRSFGHGDTPEKKTPNFNLPTPIHSTVLVHGGLKFCDGDGKTKVNELVC